MDKRMEFAQVLAQLQAVREEYQRESAPDGPTQKAFDDDMMSEARKLGKSKPASIRAAQKRLQTKAPEVWAVIVGRWRWEAERLTKAYHDRLSQLESQLRDLAPEAALLPGPARLWRTVSASSYSSQGYGAERYAQAAAQQYVDVAECAGIKAEVLRCEERGPTTGCTLVSFEVRAEVAANLDLEILSRRPGPTLREQVRLSWKRGVNPRVYNPYLPHDYEARHGLDYFGGETRPSKVPQA